MAYITCDEGESMRTKDEQLNDRSLTMSGAQFFDSIQVGVYFWKRGETWLYVGASENMLYRIARHNVIGKVEKIQRHDEIGFIPCGNLLELEAEMIHRHAPTYSPKRVPIGSPIAARTCMACRNVFRQARPHQVWCSTKCRNGSNRLVELAEVESGA